MTKSGKILACCIAMTAMALTSSCKSKNKVVRADDYDSETIVDLTDDSPAIDFKSQIGKKSQAKAKTGKVTPTPIDGDWTIIAAGGKEIRQDSDMPYLIFSDDDGRFYASNGCNIINGDYRYDFNKMTVEFSNVVSTQQDCPDITYQHDISVVLNDGVSVKAEITHNGHESYLLLKSKSNDLLLTLRHNNMEVLNGQWIVTKIGDTNIDNPEMNIFLDIPMLSIHGNTGCNFFNGKIDVDPFNATAISFTQMGVTMRMCANADNEREMLVALEEVTSYRLIDQNTLQLTDDNDKCLVTLTRDTSIK